MNQFPFLEKMFPNALRVLERRLADNEPRKKSRWKRQDYQVHMSHLSGHYNGLQNAISDDDDLAGVGVRALMALEKRENGRP